MPEFRCAAVVLAAGASTRLGQPKQLIRFAGESLLHRTARLAREAGCAPVFVVLGFEAEKMRPDVADLAVEVVVNSSWQEGMGASLRSGMEAVSRADPQPEAVMVLVCDQPRLSLDHLGVLLTRHRTPSRTGRDAGNVAITASVYGRRAGVPAVFSSKLFPKLLASRGDRGARDLIRDHAAEIQAIPWPAGELDLDLPEDLTTIER